MQKPPKCVRCLQPYDPGENEFGACRWHTAHRLAAMHPQFIEIEDEFELYFPLFYIASGMIDINYVSRHIPLKDILVQVDSPCTRAIKEKLDVLPKSTADVIRSSSIRKFRGELTRIYKMDKKYAETRREAWVLEELLSSRPLASIDEQLREEDAREDKNFRVPHQHLQFGKDYDADTESYTWRCCGQPDSAGGCWTGVHSSINRSPDPFTTSEFVRGSFIEYFYDPSKVVFGSEHKNNPITNAKLLEMLEAGASAQLEWDSARKNFVRDVILFNAYNGYEFALKPTLDVLHWDESRRMQQLTSVERALKIEFENTPNLTIRVTLDRQTYVLKTVLQVLKFDPVEFLDDVVDFSRVGSVVVPLNPSLKFTGITLPLDIMLIPVKGSRRMPRNPRQLTEKFVTRVQSIQRRRLYPEVTRLADLSWLNYEFAKMSKKTAAQSELLRQYNEAGEIANLDTQTRQFVDFAANDFVDVLTRSTTPDVLKILKVAAEDLRARYAEYLKLSELVEKRTANALIVGNFVAIWDFIQEENRRTAVAAVDLAAVEEKRKDVGVIMKYNEALINMLRTAITASPAKAQLGQFNVLITNLENDNLARAGQLAGQEDMLVLEGFAAELLAIQELVTDLLVFVENLALPPQQPIVDIPTEKAQLLDDFATLSDEFDVFASSLLGRKQHPLVKQMVFTIGELIESESTKLKTANSTEELALAEGALTTSYAMLEKLRRFFANTDLNLDPIIGMFLEEYRKFSLTLDNYELKKTGVAPLYPAFKQFFDFIEIELFDGVASKNAEMLFYLPSIVPITDYRKKLKLLESSRRVQPLIDEGKQLALEWKYAMEKLINFFDTKSYGTSEVKRKSGPKLKDDLQDNIDKFLNLYKRWIDGKPKAPTTLDSRQQYYKKTKRLVEFTDLLLGFLAASGDPQAQDVVLQVDTNRNFHTDVFEKFQKAYVVYKNSPSEENSNAIRAMDAEIVRFIGPLLRAYDTNVPRKKSTAEDEKRMEQAKKKRNEEEKQKREEEEERLRKFKAGLQESIEEEGLSKGLPLGPISEFVRDYSNWLETLKAFLKVNSPLADFMTGLFETGEFFNKVGKIVEYLKQNNPDIYKAILRVKWGGATKSTAPSLLAIPLTAPQKKEDESEENYERRLNEFNAYYAADLGTPVYQTTFNETTSITLENFVDRLAVPFQTDMRYLFDRVKAKGIDTTLFNKNTGDYFVDVAINILAYETDFATNLLAQLIKIIKFEFEKKEKHRVSIYTLKPEQTGVVKPKTEAWINEEEETLNDAAEAATLVDGSVMTFIGRIREFLENVQYLEFDLEYLKEIVGVYVDIFRPDEEDFDLDSFFYVVDPIFLDVLGPGPISEEELRDVAELIAYSGDVQFDRNAKLRENVFFTVTNLYDPESYEYPEKVAAALQFIKTLHDNYRKSDKEVWTPVRNYLSTYTTLDEAFKNSWSEIDAAVGYAWNWRGFAEAFTLINRTYVIQSAGAANAKNAMDNRTASLGKLFSGVNSLCLVAQKLFPFRDEVQNLPSPDIFDVPAMKSISDEAAMQLAETATRITDELSWTRRFRSVDVINATRKLISDALTKLDSLTDDEMREIYLAVAKLGMQFPRTLKYTEGPSDEDLERQKLSYNGYLEFIKPSNWIVNTNPETKR